MSSDTMIKRLQPFMRKSDTFKQIFDAESPQYASREAAIEDLKAQMSVNTATWALSIYEREYGIKTNPSKSLQERRAAILAKMRGTGKFTASMARAIVQAFTDRVVDVTFNGRIRIHFDDLADLDLGEIAAALEEVKPAHIDVEYELGSPDVLEITDNIVLTLRRYHTIAELRVGMKLMKYQSEVTL